MREIPGTSQILLTPHCVVGCQMMTGSYQQLKLRKTIAAVRILYKSQSTTTEWCLLVLPIAYCIQNWTRKKRVQRYHRYICFVIGFCTGKSTFDYPSWEWYFPNIFLVRQYKRLHDHSLSMLTVNSSKKKAAADSAVFINSYILYKYIFVVSFIVCSEISCARQAFVTYNIILRKYTWLVNKSFILPCQFRSTFMCVY